MKITGQKKLMKQFHDLPIETHTALKKSLYNNAKFGARKAKAIVPVDKGGLKAGINAQVVENEKGIFAFINFNDGTKADAIKVGAVNYGRKGSGGGYGFIKYTKNIVGARSANAVKRAINKAIKDAVNG